MQCKKSMSSLFSECGPNHKEKSLDGSGLVRHHSRILKQAWLGKSSQAITVKSDS